MAGTRGRSTRNTLRAKRSTKEDTEVPDVFRDLLSEAAPSRVAGADEDKKTLKKRRTARPSPRAEAVIATPQKESQTQPDLETQIATSAEHSADTDGEQNSSRGLQTITDDSEASEESDFEWEDALGQIEDQDGESSTDEPPINDLSITIGADKGDKSDRGKTTRQARRRGITSVDKKRRLDIHKVHILCLLYHVHLRNAWCNDEGAQATLRRLAPSKALSNLVPNPEHSQTQAAKNFLDGLKELKMMWANRFSTTSLGMRKPRWADSPEDVQDFQEFDNLDLPMDRQDFRRAASSLRGSQDVGAQLFCTLLRSVGVEARLVCSLQCLPFASAAQASTPQKPKDSTNSIVLDPYGVDRVSNGQSSKSTTPTRPKRISRIGHVMSGRPAHYDPGKAPPPPRPKQKYHTPYPVYWVEAFNSAVQKWVVVDPLSTSTIDRPDRIEPPLNFSQNSLVYAVAFEEDATAKDVTRRYAKAYNAKTRRFRVESTDDGKKWWKSALKPFRRRAGLDRDQLEDAALARKEAAEGIPRNVQDFKSHPVYVLERHLRHNEVIQPKHQVGKINVGTSVNPNMEPIYRRRDVHVVRSADKWYRLGRDVKDGEQPLKHAKPRRTARRSLTPDMDVDEAEDIGAGLYSLAQTDLYIPPPVVRGRVPRNAYGNLDVYVPSMIPPGGFHIRHPQASKAARIVGVDFADAVTGFQFKGRHGTAIVQGIIIAMEYREAVEAILDGMEYAKEKAENTQRSAEALRMWRRFFLGLRIAQRVNAYEIDGETADVQEDIDEAEEAMDEEQMAGGFFPAGGSMDPSTPVINNLAAVSQYDGGDAGGGFFPDDHISGALHHQYSNDHEMAYSRESQNATFCVMANDMAGGFQRDGDIAGGFERTDDMASGSEKPEVSLDIPGEMENPIKHGSSHETDIHESLIRDDAMEETLTTNNEQNPGSNDIPSCAAVEAMTNHQSSGSEFSRAAQVTFDSSNPKPPGALSSNAPEPQTFNKSESDGDVIIEGGEPASEDDRDSLPLEDPEDEDADPDWLVDMT